VRVVRRRVFILLLLCSALLAGCGGGSETTATPEGEGETIGMTDTGAEATTTAPETPSVGGDAEAGKAIFAEQACGSCHVLEDAGASGTIGPNLDESQPDLELAIDRVTNGKSPMPAFKDKLTEQQIADVSAYVVEATAG
jgi:cytochrome c6